MSILTEEKIVKQSTPSNFAKGEALYKNSPYTNITCTVQENDSNVLIYKTNIISSNKQYEAFINIHKTYGILYYGCDCEEYNSFYDGMCPHLVCLALSIMNNNSIKEPSNTINKQEVLVTARKENEIQRDKLILEEILTEYSTKVQSEIRNVVLLPIINTIENTLALKIGISYMYTVTNIYGLLKNVRDNEYYSYGQKLAFTHSIHSFDERSQALISLLSKTTALINIEAPKLHITPYILEEIINLYKETQININGTDCYLSNEEYSIKVSLHKNKSLDLNISQFSIIDGYLNNYIIIDRRLYTLTEISKELLPLVKYLKEHRKLSFKNTEDEFLNNLYPIIYDKIEVDPEFSKNHPVIKLIIDSYLDYENGVITINPQYEMLNLMIDGAVYNKKLEDAYYEDIINLGFYKNNDNYMIDSAEGITKFLSSNLDSLKNYGNVYVSDSLSKINTSFKMPTINISYDVNMMSVVFDDLSYSEEELYEIYKAYSKQKRFVILNNDQIVKIDENYHDVYTLIKDLNLDPKHLLSSQNIPLYLAMKAEGSSYVNCSKEIKNMYNDIRQYQNASYPLDEALLKQLRPYQLDGFKWLKMLTKYGFGGILADDMGLGKTIQIISLLASDDEIMPSLIVCPTSLTYNWKNEIEKWAPYLSSTIISGTANHRYELIKSIKPERRVYITSYDSLRRDIEYYQEKFRYIIIDEAQYIKNYFTQKAQAVKLLDGCFRFALTGTPIENSLLDLWSIFDFLMPDFLNTYSDFRLKYTASIEDESLSNLSNKLKPFILRRTKKDVLTDLPDKIETIRVAQMTNSQRKLYEAHLLKIRNSLKHIDNRISVLSMITRLRQICVDPALFIDDYLGGSAKVDLCMEIIDEAIANNHRILLFSQFKSLFPIIEERLNEKNILFYELTGETLSKERIRLVDSFNVNEEIKVFLISLKAGGTGLNLTGADTVIHFDPWWNVSTENQATDRTHRIGQTRVVYVNKLICENSIEQKVIELQNIKKDLSNKVISDEETLSKLTDSDIKFLLS